MENIPQIRLIFILTKNDSTDFDRDVEEWKLHNLAYNLGYKQERTGDCDFNNADEGMGFWDFVGR